MNVKTKLTKMQTRTNSVTAFSEYNRMLKSLIIPLVSVRNAGESWDVAASHCSALDRQFVSSSISMLM